MPNPRRHISYLTLAGAILALSALRVGARVQVTLWSGTNEFLVTDGFVRDEDAVLQVLTGFFGGATAFPLHVLRKTYLEQKRAQPTHIVVSTWPQLVDFAKAFSRRQYERSRS